MIERRRSDTCQRWPDMKWMALMRPIILQTMLWHGRNIIGGDGDCDDNGDDDVNDFDERGW